MAEAATDVAGGRTGGKTLEQIRKLLALAQDLHEKEGEVLAEVTTLLEGGASIGTKLKAVERAFDAAWCARYAPGQSGRYVWQYVKDVPQIKRLLKILSLEAITERALNYLRDDDPFFTKARHPFGFFVSSINRFAPAADAPPEMQLAGGDARPYACVHTPACRNDAEHTRRRMSELRAIE
jgi:hypothetical protein